MNLLDYNFEQLKSLLVDLGEKPFRAQQLFQWIHQRGVTDFAQMSNIGKLLAKRLAETATISLPEIIKTQVAKDGTHKWLLKLTCGNSIETVFIPEKNRGTLCVSSQVGCGLNCSFCSTAKQGFNRNLTTAEIIGQVFIAVRELRKAQDSSANHKHSQQLNFGRDANRNEHRSLHPVNEDAREVCNKAQDSSANHEHSQQLNFGRDANRSEHRSLHTVNEDAREVCNKAQDSSAKSVTNVVMMGMGEPLLNFDNVIAAMDIMMHDFAYGLSKRRVTLSTSGLIPEMERLKNESPVALAVSLHATNDELRNKLVPVNKKYPLADLMAVCRSYFKNESRRKITFEYVMLKDINDKLEHAKELLQLLQNVPAKVNLIPFNPFPYTEYRCSDMSTIIKFRDYLVYKGINTTIRKTRGDDIDAACGQLAGEFNDRTSRSQRWQKLHFAPIENALAVTKF